MRQMPALMPQMPGLMLRPPDRMPQTPAPMLRAPTSMLLPAPMPHLFRRQLHRQMRYPKR